MLLVICCKSTSNPTANLSSGHTLYYVVHTKCTLFICAEGSTVSTKHGNVNTDYILFICSGAFHACKPSDMLAELQGRLPIRVELKALM